jgi:tetratricopeptide (TPR) repeat protein
MLRAPDRTKEDQMSRKYLAVLFLFVWGASGLTPAAVAAQNEPAGRSRARESQATHLQKGLASFEQGFYEHLPKGKRAEAEASFAGAVRELELALSDDPNSREAHRTLARIETVRGNHLAAASHYRRLTEIDPFDIDSYALGASALAEAGRFAESRTELEKAKGRTADPRALALLEGYLAKLAEAEKQAGAGR